MVLFQATDQANNRRYALEHRLERWTLNNRFHVVLYSYYLYAPRGYDYLVPWI
jgi:hypothetical protein